jgi:hypothetical protein
MRFTAIIALALVAATGLAGCGEPRASVPPLVPVSLASSVEPLEVERNLLDRAWIDAAEGALARPTVVELPYAEWGGFLSSEPGARGFAFKGSEGQVVKVALARPETPTVAVAADGNVRVELFLVQTRAGEISHVRLAEIPSGESA